MSKLKDDPSSQDLLKRTSKHPPGLRWSGNEFRKWPTEPQPIKKWNSSRILSVLLDIGLLALALCFAAFAICVRSWEGSSADSKTYRNLARAAQLAPTIFPILFAAIVGRALKAVALWRLEKGATLGHLDQLIGSMSITTTVTTQFKLRALNLLSAALIVLWALSPLGGQGSIRVLATTMKYTNSSTQLQYLNLTFFPGQLQNGDTEGLTTQSNSLFAAALSSPLETRRSPRDTWGNVKIPVLEELNASNADSDGWVSPGPADPEYASLIGLPLSTIAVDSNTYFTVETNYWHLDCPPLSQVNSPVSACNISEWYTLTEFSRTVTGMYLSSHAANQYDLWNRSDTNCRQLAYCSWDSDGATAVNCSMKNTYVEAQVHCTGLACSVPRMRKSRAVHPPVCWTQLDYGERSFGWYALPLINSLGSFHVESTTPFQGFLVRPSDPFNMTDLDPVHELSPDVFALRLSQLMNTYWYTILGSQAIQYGVTNQNMQQEIPDAAYDNSVINITPGFIETFDSIIACDHAWLAILLLAVIVLVAVNVTGIIATWLSIGPEIAFNVSSTIKDSPFIAVPFGGSTLAGSDRARMLKHIRVRYGDVDGDDEVGSIAIATPRAAPLKKGRLYA